MFQQDDKEFSKGFWIGLVSTSLWGIVALFYHQLVGVYAWNLLFYRIIVSEVLLCVLIVVTGRYKNLLSYMRHVSWGYVFAMALILGAWWFIFIWGVLTQRVHEVALGYFISPLMSVAAARFVFKEEINKRKKVSITLAFIGVLALVVHDVVGGDFPWIALTAGGCFSLYAILKKHVPGDALMVQFLEVSLLFPFAIVLLLFWLTPETRYHWFVAPHLDLFMISLGFLSVLPLWGFSYASHKIPLVWTSFLQFVPPTGNFILGTFVFHEVLTWQEILVFVCIWVGIAIFLWDAFLVSKEKKKTRKREHLDPDIQELT